LAAKSASRIVTGKPGHGVVLSKDEKTLYVGSLDGGITSIDLATKTVAPWVTVGKKLCGVEWDSEAKTIWGFDLTDGNMYNYDPIANKVVDQIPIDTAVCGVGWLEGGKKALVSGHTGGNIYLVDMVSKKVEKKIETGGWTHISSLSPDGKYFYVSNGKSKEARDAGEKGEIIVIDAATFTIKERIPLDLKNGTAEAHDIVLTKDGKFAIIPCRGTPTPDEGSLLIVDLSTKKIVERIPACRKACHEPLGPTTAKHSALCGAEIGPDVSIAWK
ncbi:MAG: YncE family protein, partial [Euryarchaeota archaeon]|nr:YncE family protein [Euryarchaeota archaeon]